MSDQGRISDYFVASPTTSSRYSSEFPWSHPSLCNRTCPDGSSALTERRPPIGPQGSITAHERRAI